MSATGLTGCDYASVPAAKKISYSYDGKNQLLDTTYGDGSPSITRTRWPDGLLHTLGSGNSARSYDYNQRRLPTAEQLTRAGGPTAVITTSYDANGNVQSTTYPDGAVVAYNPNALGEPSQVGGYATGISYFPNGTVAGYTLGNGIAHTTTQNLRNLPRTVSESGVYQDQYDYDANGNVSALTDLQQGVTTKSMTYDGLDRLTGSTAPNEWGTATYAYDPVDNLRRSVIAPRDSIHHYTNNLLQYIAISGQPSLDYGYDLQGNVISRGGQVYNFDIGNRMQLASGLETYEYDGNGLRFNLTATNGRTKFQMYAQNGKLMYGTEQAPGYSPATVRYMYLGGKLIAETYGDGTTSYVHTDGLGSPVARSSGTSATPGPYTRYEPYGNSTAAGPAPNPIGFTGHVNDVDTGMIYMQQRYYDSWAGRFLSVDPVVTDVATGSSFGRYHYANNNPYRYTDPDGRDPWWDPSRVQSPPPPPPPSRTSGPPANLSDCQRLTRTSCGWGADDVRYNDGNGPSSSSVAAAPSAAVNSPGGPQLDMLSQGEARFIIGLAPGVGLLECLFNGCTKTETAIGVAGIVPLGKVAGVVFKTGHYAARLEKAGVNVVRAETAVAKEVNAMRGNLAANADVAGRLTVDGVRVEYRVRVLPSGNPSVGTIFEVK